MAINTYQCAECGFKEEYIESFSVSKDLWHPETCPKCNKGNMEKIFDMDDGKGGFDIIGECYMNRWGKHAWKSKMSLDDQAKVIAGEKDPY